MGDPSLIGRLTWAGLAYLPAELVVAGLAFALYGARPRAFLFAWAAYAGGPSSRSSARPRPSRLGARPLSPDACRQPATGGVEPVALFVLSATALVLAVVGFRGFRDRNIPQT
jgi:ABC-2 type transport system permease protein